MNTASPDDPATAATTHPAWLRATHWVNLAAVLLMTASGWRIYNAAPLHDFRFPPGATLGGWLGGALQWHFAAMWLLVGNGALYLAINLGSGRFFRRLLPLRPAGVAADIADLLRGRLAHADPSQHNQLQRAAYLFAIADLGLLVLSGLVLWKSVQFPLLRELIGGYEAARRVHFAAMAALLAFALGHAAMALAVPRTLLAMLRGR